MEYRVSVGCLDWHLVGADIGRNNAVRLCCGQAFAFRVRNLHLGVFQRRQERVKQDRGGEVRSANWGRDMSKSIGLIFSLLVISGVVMAEDWTHWRGPNNDGHSFETGLPMEWSRDGENLLWRNEEFGARNTPIVMNGRVYVICRSHPESTEEGEKTVCVNAETGELIWESVHNIYLSDAPAERTGWSSVAGDPETDTVFAQGLGCVFQCLEGATGKILWERSLSEEFGLLSTYGGRTNAPVIFEDMVIVSGITTGWGETAIPAHRFFAMDKRTGQVRWVLSTRLRPDDTTYTTPVFTTLNGEAAMVFSAGDGAVYAVQPRTGRQIWKYQASKRGINSTPIVDENGIVYGGHAEQNAADTTILGAVFAFNGNTRGEIAESDLLWKIPKRALGRSSMVKLGDRIYFLEDGALLVILDAKTGEEVAEKKVGRIMFGSPVVADGRIYLCENTGRFYVLEPTDTGFKIAAQTRLAQGEEVFGSVAIANGRIYLSSVEALYCIGSGEPRRTAATVPNVKRNEVELRDRKISQLVVSPTETILQPGDKVSLQVRGYNSAGQFIRMVEDAQFAVEGGGSVSGGVFTAPASGPAGVKITATSGEATGSARSRVIPAFPWKFDFADGQVPTTWIGANYRHKPAEVDGATVLRKVSTIPKGTRSQAWMGITTPHDYTIQADFHAINNDGQLPDMGLINQRYTLDMMGAQRLQIRSWTARLELRFAKTIPFEWEGETWYTMKFQSETGTGGVILRGKVWKRGEAEPAEWQIEATDAVPNLQGSPGLFGNAKVAEFLIDNVMVTDNE